MNIDDLYYMGMEDPFSIYVWQTGRVYTVHCFLMVSFWVCRVRRQPLTDSYTLEVLGVIGIIYHHVLWR